MNQGAFKLKDAQFWKDSTRLEDELVDRFDEDEAFMGLVLDGPREVQLDKRSTLPLLAVRASTLVDNSELDLHDRAILVATRIEGHEALAALAFRQPSAPPDDEPFDDEPPPEGRTVQAFSLSVTESLKDFPWKPSTWQTTLLLFDQRSNPVVTRLEDAHSRDPAVLEFLAAQRRPGYPTVVSAPGSPSTNLFRPRKDSPPPPAETGIVLALDGVAVSGPGKACMLRGSFCLPIRARDVVRPLPGPAGSQAERQALADGWVDVGDPEAVAVVPIMLLLTGDKDPAPILVPLGAGVYGSIEGQLARGQFAIDLFRAVPDLPIQSYAVWALSRTIISDPVRVGIMTEYIVPTPGP